MSKFKIEIEFKDNFPLSIQVVKAIDKIAQLVNKDYICPGENWGNTTIGFGKLKTTIKYKTELIKE